MFNARPDELVKMVRVLQDQISGFPDIEPERLISEADWSAARQHFEVYARDCRGVNLKASLATCERVLERLDDAGFTYGELRKLNQEFLGRLEDELKSERFLYIPLPKRQYYERWLEDTRDSISNNFPLSMYELEESGKCFATGRNIGAVFHSMRALEIGLVALADALSVPSDRANWQQIIDQIEKGIRGIDRNRGPSWKQDEQFYSEAAVQFRYFKNAWRNHVMHVRDQYDEERARAILDHTKEFLIHLSSRLKESGL